MPGSGLPSSDELREELHERIVKIAKTTALNLPSVETRHMTLWAAKENQDPFLADIRKIEGFLEQKQAEPLRSGLDKRTAHLVVLKTHYEFEKWINALHDEAPETFQLPDAPRHDDMKAAVLKSNSFYMRNLAVICLAEQDKQWPRRMAAAVVGYMNIAQQIEPGRLDPLATGFANAMEALVMGQPRMMIFSNSYHNENRELGNDARAWLRLVQDRVRTKKVSGVRELLRMDTTTMLLPHFAESWTLAGLLMKQPDKFGKLVVALREEKDSLKAIEQVYGWDEKQLENQWHKGVLAQR